MTDPTTDIPAEEERRLGLADHALVLVIVCVIALFGNTVATGSSLAQGAGGLVVLYAICMAGIAIGRVSPFRMPSVAWISLVGIVVSTPWVPGSGWILERAANVNFLTLATPCLAYAGIAIARREIDIARKSGWKMLVIAILVMTGTYLGSALIAQLFL